MTTTTLIWLAIAFCSAGTTFALLLFRGARQSTPKLASPFPPILRTEPRPTDWTSRDGHIIR